MKVNMNEHEKLEEPVLKGTDAKAKKLNLCLYQSTACPYSSILVFSLNCVRK